MPTLQEQAVKMTKEAQHAIFRTARHVPEDKRTEWTPMGEARSVLGQLTECALVPYFFLGLLSGQPMDMSDPATQEKRKKMEAAIVSLETAEEAAGPSHAALYDKILSMSDADLDASCPLPWDPNAKASDVIFFTYWNLVYHIGQINYIQTMLGDTEMHM